VFKKRPEFSGLFNEIVVFFVSLRPEINYIKSDFYVSPEQGRRGLPEVNNVGLPKSLSLLIFVAGIRVIKD
jgi:hypothetical protein